MAHQDNDSWINCICGSLCVGKSRDMNVGKIWTHWESNSRPLECITWHAPPLHHMPLQSTFMFPGLPINRIYPLSTSRSSGTSQSSISSCQLFPDVAHVTWSSNTHSGMSPTPIHSTWVTSPFPMQSKASVVCSTIPPILTLGDDMSLAHGTYPPGLLWDVYPGGPH